MGCSLRGVYCKKNLFPPICKLHIIYLELNSIFLAIKDFQDLCTSKIVLIVTDNTSSGLHKERRHEVRPTVCTRENPDLVLQEKGVSQGITLSRTAECGGRQAIQTRPSRVVPPSRDFPVDVQKVAPSSYRFVFNKIQQQIASVCVTSPGLPSSDSRCAQSATGVSGPLCLPTNSHSG